MAFGETPVFVLIVIALLFVTGISGVFVLGFSISAIPFAFISVLALTAFAVSRPGMYLMASTSRWIVKLLGEDRKP
jgi:hypothetical protein